MSDDPKDSPTTTTTTTTEQEAPPLPISTFSEANLVPAPTPELPSSRWERRKKKVVLPLLGVSALSSLAAAILYQGRVIDEVLGLGFILVMPVIVSSLLALLTPKKTAKQTAGYTALVHLATFGVMAAVGGEGALCLLMATPILYLLSLAGSLMFKAAIEEGLLPRSDRKFRALLAILISIGIPQAGRAVDQRLFHHPADRDAVASTVVVPASPDRVWASLQHLSLQFNEPEPWTWAWLLPRPTAVVGDGARVGATREVQFENGTVAAIVTGLDEGKRYDVDLVVTNAGREFFDHWIDLKSSRFDISDDGHGGSIVVHSTTYRPLMYPRVVFHPIEQFFGQLIQQHLLDVYGDQVLPQVQASGAPVALQ